jgi:uncharacterized membrane protein
MNKGVGRAVRIGAPVAAVLLIVVGVALTFVVAGNESFGWFAYAPLAEGTMTGGGSLLLLTGSDQLGLALVVLGLLLLTFWSGYRTGRRRRS